METPESQFANALDRRQALLQNMKAGGGSWTAHKVMRAQVPSARPTSLPLVPGTELRDPVQPLT
jgi:hypothetical protein